MEDVSLVLGRTVVLDGLSLDLERGESLAILGPSGAGKSSLLRVVLGLAAPDRGVVRLHGRVASRDGRVVVPPRERGIAVVFQDLALWPHMTVEGNLAFCLEARGIPRSEHATRVSGVLDRVGLAGMARRFPGELSGGERQRVAIARALVTGPDIVLFDEPLSDLDVVLKRELLALICELAGSRDTTTLWVTHDPEEAMAVGDRIAVMEKGRIVQHGTLDELCDRPATRFVEAVCRETANRGFAAGSAGESARPVLPLRPDERPE